MRKKVVIIGGGMGGLFTGAFLAKEGYGVTVLEKNRIAGGGLQCFYRRGHLFETGIHILGGFQEGGNLNKICRYLGIMDKLSIKNTDDDAIDSITYGSDGKTYYIPRGRERFVEGLSREFPTERDNIQRYVDAMYALTEEVSLFYLRLETDYLTSYSERFAMPADTFISQYVTDTRLRELLAYMNPMYGGVAGHTPAYVHALINVLYIEGSAQFEGGSQQLADALSDVICQHGGWLVTGDEVVEVVVQNRMVEKVRTRNGKEYIGDWYISDVHPCTLIKLTGEHAFPKAYRNRLDSIKNSYSCFSVYIQFKPECEPYVNHPRYYQRADNTVWNLGEIDEENWPAGFMCITPPSRQQGQWASRMVVNCVMSFDQVRQWEHTTVGRRGRDYLEWKEVHKSKILDTLEDLYPGIREHIDFAFASSPLTIRDYYGTKEGSLYGFMRDCHNLVQSQVPIATKTRNLLLTGQNVNLHGICGVPLTAIEVAEALVGRGKILEKINNYSLK